MCSKRRNFVIFFGLRYSPMSKMYGGERHLCCSLVFTPALEFTRPHMQWIPRPLFPGLKRPRREADHCLNLTSRLKTRGGTRPLPLYVGYGVGGLCTMYMQQRIVTINEMDISFIFTSYDTLFFEVKNIKCFISIRQRSFVLLCASSISSNG
jgi:hypothetical protein